MSATPEGKSRYESLAEDAETAFTSLDLTTKDRIEFAAFEVQDIIEQNDTRHYVLIKKFFALAAASNANSGYMAGPTIMPMMRLEPTHEIVDTPDELQEDDPVDTFATLSHERKVAQRGLELKFHLSPRQAMKAIRRSRKL